MKSEPPEPQNPTHDDLIKGLLSRPRLLAEFFRAFVPEVLEFADMGRIEYLDKEHPRAGRRPRRTGDMLVKPAGWTGMPRFFSTSKARAAMSQPCWNARVSTLTATPFATGCP